MPATTRIAGRRLRAVAFNYHQNTIVAQTIVPFGEDLTVGRDATARLLVPNWSGPTLVLLSKDQRLYIARGMRVHMCHDDGEDRIVGEFDELVASGLAPPLLVTVSKLNIRVRDGLSVFAKYLRDDEPDWPARPATP